MKKVYVLIKENFNGNTAEVDIYSTLEKASKALEEIEKEFQDCEEFTIENNGCNWWDSEDGRLTSVYITTEEIK